MLLFVICQLNHHHTPINSFHYVAKLVTPLTSFQVEHGGGVGVYAAGYLMLSFYIFGYCSSTSLLHDQQQRLSVMYRVQLYNQSPGLIQPSVSPALIKDQNLHSSVTRALLSISSSHTIFMLCIFKPPISTLYIRPHLLLYLSCLSFSSIISTATCPNICPGKSQMNLGQMVWTRVKVQNWQGLIVLISFSSLVQVLPDAKNKLLHFLFLGAGCRIAHNHSSHDPSTNKTLWLQLSC